MSGRRCSKRRRARPTAEPGLTDGVAIEVRRVDVPRGRGVRAADVSDPAAGEGTTEGLIARCNDGLVLAVVVDKTAGRIRLRITPV